MKGVLHVIVGTPDSNRRSTLAHAINPTDKKLSSHFLFPHELESTELPFSHWEWIDHGFKIKNMEEENINEWFLFLSNRIEIADQFESLQEFLDQEEELEIKRIINYRVNHNQKFDENFIKALKANMPEMVYVYSQNTASSFLNFIKIYQSESLWMNTNLMCIGEKTSSILNEIKWKKIFLFNPGEEEFLLYKI